MDHTTITTAQQYADKAERIIARIAEDDGYDIAELKQEIIETATNIRFGEWNDTVRNTMDYYRLDPDDAKCILRWGEDQ